jgi:PAS domain-containing protein
VWYASSVLIIGVKRNTLHSRYLFSCRANWCMIYQNEGTPHHPFMVWYSGTIMATAEKSQTTFRVDKELLKQFQHALVDHDQSMSAVIEELIRRWLAPTPATSNNLLTVIAQQAPVAIVIKDLDGTIVWGNAEYEKLLAKPLAALRGKKITAIWSTSHAAEVTRHDRQVIEAQKTLAVLETVPAGRTEHVRFTIRFPIFDSTGTLVHVGAIGCYLDDVFLAQLKSGQPVILSPPTSSVPSKRRGR